MPLVAGAPWPDAAKAEQILQVFCGVFQAHQPHLRYRPIPERDAGIVGQLDPFLLNAFGTPSVTVEVSRPRLQLLAPWRLLHPFCWASPSNPDFWVENDADATIQALALRTAAYIKRETKAGGALAGTMTRETATV